VEVVGPEAGRVADPREPRTGTAIRKRELRISTISCSLIVGSISSRVGRRLTTALKFWALSVSQPGTLRVRFSSGSRVAIWRELGVFLISISSPARTL
jgi:hypothetical protein